MMLERAASLTHAASSERNARPEARQGLEGLIATA
jgi:hypothetical protein